MFSSTLRRFFTAFSIYALINVHSAVAAPIDMGSLDLTARTDLAARASAAAAPHFVIYGDKWVSGGNGGPPAASAIKGYNVFALSFLLSTGPADQAQAWASLTDAQRKSTKADYEKAGIKLIVSAFGSTETPTSSNKDPVATANTIAAWVIKYGLDGVDVDYEDFQAMNAGKAEQWLISFTKQLRSKLPAGKYIITHAPVAPWFSPGNKWTGGGYLQVNKEVGSMIDWYNLQFYNQGATEYTTCDGLLNKSSATWPKSSIFEIAASGVDKSKLVIGKPAKSGVDANNGFIEPATLATCVSQAKAKGWNGGVMVWEFPDADAAWIKTVRGKAWPV